MPRNVTGGSGHKAQRNSESSKARNNRGIVDDLLDDYRDGVNTDGVFVGRVMRRMGTGRMEVFYTYTDYSEDEGKRKVEKTQIMPMRGGLRGKGKKDVWIDPGCLVVIAETGLAGMTHEIVAVFSGAQIARLRKVKSDIDPRLFVQEGGSAEEDDGGIIIAEEEEDDVNVDDI
jgi:hypothetical protein